MQPYFLPYIGYFQLIKCVDLFVVYDDAQWMKGGWINRNKISVGRNNEAFMTLPVRSSPLNTLIKDKEFSNPAFAVAKKQILRRVKSAYCSCPFFEDGFDLLRQVFEFQSLNTCDFIVNSLNLTCTYLGIRTPFSRSSQCPSLGDLRSVEKVNQVAKVSGYSHYVNPVGGAKLYDKKYFSSSGIELSFLRPRMQEPASDSSLKYPPRYLSILDGIMRQSPSVLSQMLCEYELV